MNANKTLQDVLLVKNLSSGKIRITPQVFYSLHKTHKITQRFSSASDITGGKFCSATLMVIKPFRAPEVHLSSLTLTNQSIEVNIKDKQKQ